MCCTFATSHLRHQADTAAFARGRRRRSKEEGMPQVLVKDIDRAEELIRERKRLGADRYDEVWNGVYVMPSMPSLEHQELVHDLGTLLDEVVKRPGLGKIYPGVNVSDRGPDWKSNYRVPDLVVVLKN